MMLSTLSSWELPSHVELQGDSGSAPLTSAEVCSNQLPAFR